MTDEVPECVTTVRNIELIPPNAWLDDEGVWCPVCHTEVRWAGVLEQREYKLQHQLWHYHVATVVLNVDWRFLSENVSGHAMRAYPSHGDGRECGFHNRLGVWTFDGDKECLRDHSR